MIYVGLDDTDVVDSPGTNQLARALVSQLAGRYRCRLIVRHQLLFDRRIPYTSKNSSASLQLEPQGGHDPDQLFAELRAAILAWCPTGSDPGLCIAESVPAEITEFGRMCQRAIVAQHEARRRAAACGIPLEGLGGTEDGVIGALAAVGLAASADDGRVVQIGRWPDDLTGWQPVATLAERDVVLRHIDSGEAIIEGLVDVGKRLRPNYRGDKVVLFVTHTEPASDGLPHWLAVRAY